MALRTEEYETRALREPDQRWELFCGVPRRKPVMTQEHQTTAWWLAHMIGNQVDPKQFQVRDNGSRAGSGNTCFIPDVIVIPRAAMKSRGPDGPLETYAEPLRSWPRSGRAARPTTMSTRSSRSTGGEATWKSGG